MTIQLQDESNKRSYNIGRGSWAELAKVFIVHSRDPGSNLGIDRKHFFSVCVAFEFKFVGC